MVKLLEGLPVNLGRRKELAGLTVPQAVEKGRALGLPTIQPKTINDGYLLHIASVFNWARKEQWVTSNPFEGLSVHDTVSDAERRSAFTADQLSTVFHSGLWQTPWAPDGRKAGDYWVPLLCLFHGLRNGEAAGLRLEDIGTDDGNHVLQLREYGERKLKTAGSRATLPIHPQLLQLGFLKYVEARRDAEEFLLFPEGTVNDRGQVGAKLGERFSAYVKSLELVGTKLGMHSFRHSFEDALRRAELAERTSSALSRRIEPGSGKAYQREKFEMANQLRTLDREQARIMAELAVFDGFTTEIDPTSGEPMPKKIWRCGGDARTANELRLRDIVIEMDHIQGAEGDRRLAAALKQAVATRRGMQDDLNILNEAKRRAADNAREERINTLADGFAKSHRTKLG